MNDKPENQQEKYQEEADSFTKEVDFFAKEVDAMKKDKSDKVFGWIFAILLTILALIVIWVNFRNSNYISDLERANEKLKIENAEYQQAQDYLEEFLDLIDEIYEGKINEAVLEERIKWLENYTEMLEEENQNPEHDYYSEYNFDYANQMFDDFLTLFDSVQDYVAIHGVIDNAFFEQFEAQYPDVYARIGQYEDLF